jgi:hypothetical protein
LVSVADALDAGDAGGLDIGYWVANERTRSWFGIEGAYCPGDEVRAGLEERGVVAGPCDDEADPVVQAVAGEVGVDGSGWVVADDSYRPAWGLAGCGPPQLWLRLRFVADFLTSV